MHLPQEDDLVTSEGSLVSSHLVLCGQRDSILGISIEYLYMSRLLWFKSAEQCSGCWLAGWNGSTLMLSLINQNGRPWRRWSGWNGDITRNAIDGDQYWSGITFWTLIEPCIGARKAVHARVSHPCAKTIQPMTRRTENRFKNSLKYWQKLSAHFCEYVKIANIEPKYFHVFKIGNYWVFF